MKNALLPIIIIVVALSSCGSKRVNYKELSKDGGVYYFQGSTFSGTAFEMYDEKKIKNEVEFKNGKQDGQTIAFNEDGSINRLYHFKDGEEHGDFEDYDHGWNSTGIKIGKYKNGKYEGVLTGYFTLKDPITKKEIQGPKGKGNVEYIKNFTNGLKNGSYIAYYENGKTEREGNWVNDKADGVWKFYYEDGSIRTLENNKNNGRICEFKEYYKNGKLQREGTWIDEGIGTLQADGILKTYYEDGKLAIIRNMKNGQVNGELKEYYRNGNLKQEGMYLNGMLQGTLKVYDSVLSK